MKNKYNFYFYYISFFKLGSLLLPNKSAKSFDNYLLILEILLKKSKFKNSLWYLKF